MAPTRTPSQKSLRMYANTKNQRRRGRMGPTRDYMPVALLSHERCTCQPGTLAVGLHVARQVGLPS